MFSLDTDFVSQNTTLHFNEAQTKAAYEKLEKYMTLMQNNNRIFESGINLTLTGEYKNASLKRSTLIDSKICNVNFGNAALTSSFFSGVEFFDSMFDESNMQYCQFVESEWKKSKILSTNLSYSNFYNVTFKSVTFKGSTVSEILFDNCTFEDCIFISSMLENTTFLCCTFKNVEFTNSNIEYMELKNCHIAHLCLPLSQFPYIFGLSQNAYKNGNNIMLSTDKDRITLNEYLDLKESLIIFFASVNEYFPLANIQLAENNANAAFNSIISGIRRAVIQRNFRMLKFFCKLAKQGNIFPYKSLRKLYMLIEQYATEQEFDIYEKRSFIYNIGEIRSMLLDSFDNYPTARITMQTNIDIKESEKVIQFIEYIDSIITNLCTQKISHIEIHHNSDCNFVAYLCAHYSEIIFVIYLLLSFSNQTINNIQQKILTQQQIVLNKLEIKEREEKLKNVKAMKEDLERQNIEYTTQFIINNPSESSIDVDMFL